MWNSHFHFLAYSRHPLTMWNCHLPSNITKLPKTRKYSMMCPFIAHIAKHTYTHIHTIYWHFHFIYQMFWFNESERNFSHGALYHCISSWMIQFVNWATQTTHIENTNNVCTSHLCPYCRGIVSRKPLTIIHRSVSVSVIWSSSVDSFVSCLCVRQRFLFLFLSLLFLLLCCCCCHCLTGNG